MHEEHEIERHLKVEAHTLSRQYAGAPVVIILGGSGSTVPRTMTASSFTPGTGRLRDLLGILETSAHIESRKHFTVHGGNSTKGGGTLGMDPTDPMDREKLKAEILQNDLAAHRGLETWGSSLFLGALGLIARQFIEWDHPAPDAAQVILEPWAYTAPAVIGLVAFVFLRVVNFRNSRISTNLDEMAGGTFPSTRRPKGTLGLILALMPLCLGYAISHLLVGANAARSEAMCLVWCFGFLVLFVALAVHFYLRLRTSTAGNS